jgi:diguanylate cyclase (GGDEF)-like protein
VTAWKEAKENLEKLNVHDHLTGVYNRIFFEWKLKKVNYGECLPLGVIVCDVDNLQAINHRLGYKKGDEALLAVSRILRHRFRAGDIIARIGGDEFAVLLTDIDDSVIRRKERQIRQGIREYDKNFPEGLFSVSLGCAVSAEVLSDVHRLLNEADTRMHQEKDQKTTINEEASVEVLVRMMKARDYNTGEHCDRLQRLLFLLGGSFELSEEETRNLSLLARFHDLGKVGVPDWVLFKPGPLTPREQEQMRAHCRIGYDIARADPRLAPIAEHILKHHERWGGGGYPLGVIGDDIPLACRLLAVADAYDAMTSDRPYRQALSHETALAELKSNAGTQFDPEAVKRFFLMINSDAFSS